MLRPLRRSPTPKCVRNITNTLVFSTSDRSLTSFLRFPPEIRVLIFGYLLTSGFPILYGICPQKRILIERDDHWVGWIRHGLFPAILETCRTINLEGSEVLYGSNLFKMDTYQGWPQVRDVWAPRQINIDAITRLSLECHLPGSTTYAQGNKTRDLMDLFPKLREIHLSVYDFSVDEWVTFLQEMNGKLKAIKRLVIVIDVSSMAGRAIRSRYRPQSTEESAAICIREYVSALRGFEAICGGRRRLRSEFEEETDDFARCHDVLGRLKIVVE